MIPRARYTVAVNDVLVLIRTGWPQMAVPLLEQLPHEITCEANRCMAAAYELGKGDQARRVKGEATPKRLKNHEWLRERIANQALRERAKASLRLGDRLLDAIATGGRTRSGGFGWRGRQRRSCGRGGRANDAEGQPRGAWTPTGGNPAWGAALPGSGRRQ
jgi:hypothetical protein